MTTTDTPRAPAPLLVAAALTGLEALALVLYGLVELASLSSSRAVMGVSTAAFFVLYGVGLGWCAWQLRRSKAWPRAPIVLAQLIQALVAWDFRGGGTTLVAVALVVLAVLVLVGVFHPASLKALQAAGRDG